MKTELRLVKDHHFIGTDAKGTQTHFDSRADDVFPAGASPTASVLEAVCACTAIDVVDILNKKRRTVSDLRISAEAERAETHPRVFTSVHLHFVLKSPDATIEDLNRCIELSQEKYCTVSAIVKRSGCPLSWTAEVQNS
jgi:putative redox protein